jgi:hypothetical protein
VIRFVTAKLKAATHLLRKRIRRMGASRIAKMEMTDAVITSVAVDHVVLCVLYGWKLRMWRSRDQ